MFLLFGDKHRTEPVPGGIECVRTCGKCGVRATFRERRVSKQFRLYFIEMFTHGTHHVLECSACGTTFVTDELRAKSDDNDQDGTVYGHLRDAAAKAEAYVRSDEVAAKLERGKAEATRTLGAARERVGGLMSNLLAPDERKD